MQPRLTVGILVLQAEGLVCAIRYLGFLFQTTPAGVFAIPQQIAVLIGHLSRDDDLVAVEVVGLLAAFIVFGCPVVKVRVYRNALCQDWKFHAGYDLLYYFLDLERVSKINFSNPIKFNKGSVNNSGLHLISNSNIW